MGVVAAAVRVGKEEAGRAGRGRVPMLGEGCVEREIETANAGKVRDVAAEAAGGAALRLEGERMGSGGEREGGK
jgi:hypothetical protein